MNRKKVVLSGIRATGNLHLGNYLGAIRNFATLSHDPGMRCFFFVANLHTLTTKINPDDIKRDLPQIVLDFVACGVDPEKSVIFAQSSVPETCELSWLLGCLAPVADLERMPHFKDKRDKKEALGEMINAGLLTYPVLMAADILGPQADVVPVGEDQYPHVELARELARRFNVAFGETFRLPEVMTSEAVRVPGLDGTGKMGKSDQNTIDLADSAAVVRAKVMQAFTDPSRKRRKDAGDPAKCNIYSLHLLISRPDEISHVLEGCRSAGIGCTDCKEIMTKNLVSLLQPIQARKAELVTKGPDYPLEILAEGGKKARKVIAVTVAEAKDRMGVPMY